ncbi:cytochrome c oxidase accessory protein CcoG [Helicobacter jaachi]|uniref:Cytochrome c oxidase accessory protein CcoG n=1 Tax=Helicobacter jaachi TaxID=1677920 RepID=A0A4U8TAR5_9HELI|nr:cytochrome c oxidase accessory protein CcoG [Helicobacter jaachi]TLD96925.1 cytochrome c oxidase accessory protein CcoG [Helicobacter jaachi]
MQQGFAHSYRKKRYIVYTLASLVLLIFPFIHINGHQLFLLSFDHKQLHLLGVVFDMQELYLMPFLLILMFVGIFFLTTLLGRVWCGWACPQTIFRVLYRDLLQTKIFGLRKKISNKQQGMDLSTFSAKIKAVLAFLILCVLCLMAAASLMFFFTPPSDFFAYIQEPLEHRVLLGFWLGFGIFFIFDIAFIQENFCIYMCPYCRVQSVLYDDDTVMVLYNDRRGGAVYAPNGIKNPLAPKKQNPQNECTNCTACVKVCPTHIDIRKGMQLECINCLECADACADVMAHYNRPSLINWKSTNSLDNNGKVRFVRFKTVGYVVILSIVFAILLVMGSKKETMLLNISRSGELYELRKNNIVDNHYVMLFHNTDEAEHQMFFEIRDVKGSDIAKSLEIITPKKPFRVKAGDKVKQIVTIRAKNRLAQGDYDIIIHAFATDSKDKIFVERKSKFIYPNPALLKE